MSLFHLNNIQGSELCLVDFVKYAFNIGPCLDTYEPISFKHGMMLDSTTLYNSNPV